nr:ATP phosphoribosyltransferase 1, chloroplastic [Tanacetum cinerariifolium]
MAYRLYYTKYPLVLEGYCDANWISNHNERKSISGYVFTLRRAAILWKSSEQTVNTISTMEAEFVALDKVAEEAEWLRSFLEDSPSSTKVDQDVRSPSKSQTTPETQSSVIPQDVVKDIHDIEVAHMRNDLLFGVPIPEVTSDNSSSTASPHTIVQPDHQIP